MEKNMTWKRVWMRHGWNLETVTGAEYGEGLHFSLLHETDENIQYLCTCLAQAKVDYHICAAKNHLTIYGSPISEAAWLAIVDSEGRGLTEMSGDYTEKRPIFLYELDVYVSGVVRQLNRLSFTTNYSCDGHNKRKPYVCVKPGEGERLTSLLQALGFPCRFRNTGRFHDTVTFLGDRKQMLDLAERLAQVEMESLYSEETIEEGLFQAELARLLSIPGSSGREGKVRNYVARELAPLVDECYTDSSGNLIAKATYGSGRGPVILLNSHLDVYEELLPERTIIKEDGIWRSSRGILGADDRAGIAVLLHIARYLRTMRFNGTVKYIATVEEEIGLVGARHVDQALLQDIDMAFVLDRRGSGDIVTSCGGYEPFCTEVFGRTLEEIANMSEAGEWVCTAGGSSDTRIWASAGIQCVNLSVGYGNEHTHEEWLDVKACYGTVKLLKAVFANMRALLPVVRRERRSNWGRHSQIES
ncbi:M20/M25/M40 family metallo-hydrolase [Sporosarcina sp. Te-1]|uniref:M20/M25/M40 family metallo-hydrolase n=1 Tax=Sporosarcina sp. Te-1 TaxID=2818390 RepID=UPI001A9F4244|nr:M20/M25/M40 family metallo-hydrolase [Sporosarcina sp. Te-1]QTD39469.1 M20/M25/M40 family metallo-hydrolase [Sporosarcina sp. Te-1]